MQKNTSAQPAHPGPAQPELVAVVAMTENRVIGRDGGLPWHLPADLAHFRRLSQGRPNVMGRRVWDSLGGQPLPDRPNIVLTRRPDFAAPGALAAHSPAEALELAQAHLLEWPEIAIIGGAQIYELYADQLTRLELTRIHAQIEGDTFMPDLPGDWVLTAEQFRPADERNPYDMTFETYQRR